MRYLNLKTIALRALSLVAAFCCLGAISFASDAFMPPKDLKKVVLKPKNAPMSGVQVLLFDGKTKDEVKLELDAIASSGMDTVILRVFHNEGDRPFPFITPRHDRGVYFQTDKAPVVADILGFVLKEAHARGLKVFAWMTTRYADYGIESKEKLACAGYVKETKRVGRCKGLDLFSAEAVRHIQAIYSDLAEYPIDGVLFQDDLILKYNEGFGPNSERLYKLKTGKALRPQDMFTFDAATPYARYTDEFAGWAAWKNKRLLYVASELKKTVRKKRPQVKFAINLMYESVTDPKNALNWFSQDIDAAVKEGFDYYSVMAYHKQMGSELKKSAKEIEGMIEALTVEAVRKVNDPGKVLIKLQTIDWDTGEEVPYEELSRLIKKVRGKAPVSIAVVPYRSGLSLGVVKGEKKFARVKTTGIRD